MEDKKTATKQTATQPNAPVMRSFKDSGKVSSTKVLIIFIVIFILGAGVGYFFSNKSSAGTGATSILQNTIAGPAKGKIFGSNDTKTFNDTAEGTLRNGGIDGEGQYHLERPGGDSQNVYMTSSAVDLSQFIGRKIKVWGATQTAQKAGWLMDVGRVQVL